MSEPALEPAVPACLMDADDLGAFLKCSVRHIYRLCDAGKMPGPVRLGHLVRWNREIIADWVSKGCPPVRNTTSHGGSR